MLIKILDGMKSPFRLFYYELGKEYICTDFDDDENKDCSIGFYATGIEGIAYAWKVGLNAFECECSGRNVNYDIFKRRWEKIKLIREIPEQELYDLALAAEENLGYRLSHIVRPINPLLLKKKILTENHKKMLQKWSLIWELVSASVRDSVGSSVWASFSVGSSVWASFSVLSSIGNLVWDSGVASARNSVSSWVSVEPSVNASVRASIWAYISFLFWKIKKWKYMEHEEGINPFQPCIDLWIDGFVPSFDGTTWKLHQGKNAAIVYSVKKEDLI